MHNVGDSSKADYNLVFHYVADRPVNKEDSLLGSFIDGTDTFRDARFKLIPSIVKGYGMVKHTIGSKASSLGKAVTCKYLRQEIQPFICFPSREPFSMYVSPCETAILLQYDL